MERAIATQNSVKDLTVYSFNANKQLSMVRDRHGNQTRYIYNAAGKLSQIIDPVNLTTNFAYTGDRPLGLS